jgi:hypothetical protein
MQTIVGDGSPSFGSSSDVTLLCEANSIVDRFASLVKSLQDDLFRSIESSSIERLDDGNDQDPHAALVRRIEERVRDEGRSLLASLLHHLLQSLIDARQESLRVCTRCPDARRRHQGVRGRRLDTSLSSILLRGVYFKCMRCGSTDHAVDLAARESRESALLGELIVLSGVAGASFDKAQVLCRRLMGVDVDDEVIRSRCHRAGRRIAGEASVPTPKAATPTVELTPAARKLHAFRRERGLPLPPEPAAFVGVPRPTCGPVTPGGTLVGSCDGMMIHTREHGWRELKAMHFSHYAADANGDASNAESSDANVNDRANAGEKPKEKSKSAPKPLGVYAAAYLEGAHRFAPRLRVVADLLGQDRAGRRVFVSDCAEWIARAAASQLPGFRRVADFYHAAAEAIYGKEHPRARKWSRSLGRRLRETDAHTVSDKLRRIAMIYRSPSQQRAVLDACKFLDKHAKEMAYAQFKRDGLPIDSGMMESHCKQIGQRMKGPGMRWKTTNAESMANLVSCWSTCPESAFGQPRKVA